MRASGRNHRRQIAHGLFRASGMVMLHVTTHWFVKRVQVRMPGSVLESRGGYILASAEGKDFRLLLAALPAATRTPPLQLGVVDFVDSCVTTCLCVRYW